jgi:hypothetical protein
MRVNGYNTTLKKEVVRAQTLHSLDTCRDRAKPGDRRRIEANRIRCSE